jgi:RNA 2',3'-cyclic 3'-phosphodiesterase
VTDARARLFVGLELPDAVRTALVTWRAPILEGSAGLRAMAPETIHVTLCFLGWQAEEAIAEIGDRCGEAATSPSLEMALGAPLWLPPRRPRVLAVEVQEQSGALAQLQGTLSGALSAGGWYEPESRPFLPHVTVARGGRTVRVPRSELPPPPRGTFEGSMVTLFRSRLTPSGARYEPLRVMALR